jgi:hypothetical protein
MVGILMFLAGALVFCATTRGAGIPLPVFVLSMALMAFGWLIAVGSQL